MASISSPGRPVAAGRFKTPATTAATGTSSPSRPMQRRSGWPMPAFRCSRRWPMTQNSPATAPALAPKIRYGVTIR